MGKNIAVIDEQGNRYEATWPKRARGLVKSGRARFVDEKTICLARPPDKSEDETMSKNMGSNSFSLENLNAGKESIQNLYPKDQGSDTIDELKKSAAAYVNAVQKTNVEERQNSEGQERQPWEKPLRREIVEQVLDQLGSFAADDDYIVALAEKDVDSEDIADIVKLRECTRQKHLDVYKVVLEKAIETEAGKQMDAVGQLERLQRIIDWLSALDCNNFDEDMWEMIKARVFELMNQITAAGC